MIIKSNIVKKILGIALIAVLVACGKQGPTLTPLQKVEKKYYQTSEKYIHELAIVRGEEDDDKKIKLLGKLIEKKKFKTSFWDVLDSRRPSSDKIPYHAFYNIVISDINSLKSAIKVALKKDSVMTEKLQELSDMLYEIKKYITKHKEFRAEERYLSMFGLCSH